MLTMWSRGLGLRWNSSSSYSNTGSSSTAVTPSSTRCGICAGAEFRDQCAWSSDSRTQVSAATPPLYTQLHQVGDLRRHEGSGFMDSSWDSSSA